MPGVTDVVKLTSVDVWITWWGDGKFRPSDDVGFWLGLYTSMSVAETVFISLAIMYVPGF